MSKSNEKVIELTIDETNRLRSELGLAPLRVKSTNENGSYTDKYERSNGTDDQILELTVSETNDLRRQLGLRPLTTAGNAGSSSSRSSFEHVPAENEVEKKLIMERIERTKLKRQVEQGINTHFAGNSLTDSKVDAVSWAQRMLATANTSDETTKDSVSESKKTGNNKEYDESDLMGMNVAHSLRELQEGSTTVLTLTDAPILKIADDTSKKIVGINDNDQYIALENINLTEKRKVQNGLREKRKLEMGMGRAGGYAGYDDDEFEELGGAQTPARFKRSAITGGSNHVSETKKNHGFRIGDKFNEEEDTESDLFAGYSGKAISLEVSKPDVTASDFMTAEEEMALHENKKTKRGEKFHKRKKDTTKNKKKRSRRRETFSDDEEVDEEDNARNLDLTVPTKGLIEEMEETAVDRTIKNGRKRQHSEDDNAPNIGTIDDNEDKFSESAKRLKYEQAMAKGNERARLAFEKKKSVLKSSSSVDDDEPDDAFLNEALAKARRLSRLKEISRGVTQNVKSGIDAVADALQKVKAEQVDAAGDHSKAGTITFSIDETREFTRALRARTEQNDREQARKNKKEPPPKIISTTETISAVAVDYAHSAVKNDVEQESIDEETNQNVEMEELAKHVKEDEATGSTAILDGATGTTVPLGRGVGNILNLLKQTGEMTRKNAGKEEMRGRAKDKRTYEDYEPLDLKNVVKIDEKSAQSKDLELAHREVKLEYRDKHGRLLTRKEAFRDLCYQFHGYGSGKRKEEKKLKQIEQEQAQIRLASRQAAEGGAAGTFGALKATQKATGKAFVVHKIS